jgi:hypothetical protein
MSVIEILQVNLITKEDFVSPKPFQFNPNVVKFFTTKTYLDKKILTGNNIDIRPSLFLNREIFEKAIKILKSSDYSNHTNDEIINNNIEVFKDALFSEKEQIPIGSKKYYIIKSKYVPNSFQLVKGVSSAAVKNVTQYTITFEISVLDAQRDLKEADFSRASCKLTARELNSQAQTLFGFSLGLDGEFPPMKSTAANNSMYNSGMYNRGMYNSGMYNGNMNYGSNMYNSTMNYGSMNYANTPSSRFSPIQNVKNEELLKVRRDIRELLRDYDKKKENEKKEKSINDWQMYKQSRLNEGLPVIGMNEWINKRQQDVLENKYKLEWLDYKNRQESSGKSAQYDKWIKDKLEEDLENKVESYMNEWMAYKSDQAVLGKVPNLNEWFKERVKKRDFYSVGGTRKSIRRRRKYKKSKYTKYKKYTNSKKRKTFTKKK